MVAIASLKVREEPLLSREAININIKISSITRPTERLKSPGLRRDLDFNNMERANLLPSWFGVSTSMPTGLLSSSFYLLFFSSHHQETIKEDKAEDDEEEEEEEEEKEEEEDDEDKKEEDAAASYPSPPPSTQMVRW
ncbi:hypothetical protein NQ176_g7080 [Zarea fungicola]|uniref:Uncharacterized protein n=1 Tax=Zarea fungicola TaxID=93591 RepID=A0ACC1N149_9HYPO|nr:hypothetical protein NQ176_g7080 [Lecanicillium fungicola]